MRQRRREYVTHLFSDDEKDGVGEWEARKHQACDRSERSEGLWLKGESGGDSVHSDE
jgi:hypothetical protein